MLFAVRTQYTRLFNFPTRDAQVLDSVSDCVKQHSRRDDAHFLGERANERAPSCVSCGFDVDVRGCKAADLDMSWSRRVYCFGCVVFMCCPSARVCRRSMRADCASLSSRSSRRTCVYKLTASVGVSSHFASAVRTRSRRPLSTSEKTLDDDARRGATADSSSVDADKKGIDDDDDDDDDEDVVDDDDDGRRGWETLEQDGREKC